MMSEKAKRTIAEIWRKFKESDAAFFAKQSEIQRKKGKK